MFSPSLFRSGTFEDQLVDRYHFPCCIKVHRYRKQVHSHPVKYRPMFLFVLKKTAISEEHVILPGFRVKSLASMFFSRTTHVAPGPISPAAAHLSLTNTPSSAPDPLPFNFLSHLASSLSTRPKDSPVGAPTPVPPLPQVSLTHTLAGCQVSTLPIVTSCLMHAGAVVGTNEGKGGR